MTKERPNPEKLLKRIQNEEYQKHRSKLKIYLGAAPGVGKTYTMLHDAIAKHAQGIDILVGIVESHGRQEIDSLLKNLEVLPRQVVDYRGKELLEFDLDSALKRNPTLILIDEMAHTNAPGLRHEKRWQDIKELLDRGIDVYTTLNVQHIESLSDDVSQIIHAPISETIPDSMLELADTIELIDLPPEDLLKRLQEGKVYIPERADLAVKNFFRKGNLIALRELALRVTAERVGAQVLLYRQGQEIQHIWPVKEKILVCVGPHLESRKLIRAARRMATSLQAEWIAVHVNTPKFQTSEEQHNKAIQNLRFAEQLGAKTQILTGFNIVKEVMNFAHEQNITQIMIWKHIRTRWKDLFFRNLADELVRHSQEIDIYIMTGEREESKPLQSIIPSRPSISWKIYSVASCTVILATVINFFLYPFLSTSNLVMVYLLGVTIIALFGQTGPSIFASILSVLAYDFFFIPPLYTFAITDAEYFFTLVVMLLVTQIISHLTILTRRQANAARTAEREIRALHTLSVKLANTRGMDKLLTVGLQYISEVFDSEILVLISINNRLMLWSEKKNKLVLSPKEQDIAQWVFELGQIAGIGTDTLSFSDSLYVPLLATQGSIGVLKIHPKKGHLFTSDQMRLLQACANQIALALEVDRLQEKAKRKELQVETDRVRSGLLESVSHDLRTPLVSIMASASTQIERAGELDAHKIEKLGRHIYVESEQLARLINNLLQINYLESSNVKLHKKLLSIKDEINTVIHTSSKKLRNKQVNIHISSDLPNVPFDPTLIQEVIINLLDNAIKFTAPKTPIDIFAHAAKDNIIVSIEDHGPGIVSDEVNKLFEKFYRGRELKNDRGLGLGLAICQRIIEAHGGKIWAENRKEGGAAFLFSLPLSKD